MGNIEATCDVHSVGAHYPSDPKCLGCQKAGIKIRSRTRTQQQPEIGTMAVDIAMHDGQLMLVAAHQGRPKCTLATRIATKTPEAIEIGLLELITRAEHLYGVPTISRIHGDRGGGAIASIWRLARCGVVLTTTEGNKPQSNGLAES